MIVLLLSLGAAVAVGVLAGIWVGPLGGIIPAMVVFAAVYLLVSRRVASQLEAAMGQVQAQMQRGPKYIPQAVGMLEQLKKKFGRLQFFAGASLDGQIGSILFMQEQFDKARPYLERSFVRLWNTKVMLAVLKFKKKDYTGMDAVMEKAAKYSPKQGLLWSTWAYMHQKAGHRDKAIEVLNRGKVALKDADALLNDNLLALQNGKKMKMKGYGDAWYQFHLEKHPMMKRAQRGNVRFQRR